MILKRYGEILGYVIVEATEETLADRLASIWPNPLIVASLPDSANYEVSGPQGYLFTLIGEDRS